MPKRPTDEHGADAKRARTATRAAPISVQPEIAQALQLLLDVYMRENAGCTVSLTTLVDLFSSAASSLQLAGAAEGKGGIDSSPPSQGASSCDGRESGGGGGSSVVASKHGPPQAKKHQCLTCSKCFSGASNLKKHDLVHTGVKSHSCRLCLKKFSLRHHLKKHEHTHDRK